MSEKRYIYNQSKDGTKANILIDGDIDAWWGTGLQDFARDIENSQASEVMVQINSGGGSVTEGQAIAAYIKGSPRNVNTSVLGLCASIATFIAMAGKSTSIAKGSLFMIHNASGLAYGESGDLRKTADLLDVIDDQLTNIYVDTIAKNGKLINGSREETKKQVEKWQNNETWFTAEQAVEYGFIQKLTEGVEILNKSQAQNILNSCSKYNNVPTDFINNIQNIVNMADKEPKNDNAQTEKQGLWNSIKALFASSEGKALVAESIKDAKEAEAKAIEDAKALLEAQGLKVVSEEPAKVENKAAEEEPKEEPKKEELSEVEKLKADLAAAQAKAQKLEEEKAGAPSAKAKTEEVVNTKNSPFTEEQLNGFAAIANALPKR